MDLLILLVRKNGRLISRDEIIERLWGKNLFFDTDNSINTAIRKNSQFPWRRLGQPAVCRDRAGQSESILRSSQSLPRFLEAAPVERSRIMLVILPFENLSGDPAQQPLSDGLSEETIMRLGQMSPHRLGVIARTSSMAYKQTDKSITQIGQELGVDFILEKEAACAATESEFVLLRS